MEAGYDYTLMGGRPQGNGKRVTALFVGVLAAALLIGGVAYYGWSSNAQADLAPDPAAVGGASASVSQHEDGSKTPGGTDKATKYLAPASSDVISGMSMYPAGFTESRYWVNPLGSGQ